MGKKHGQNDWKGKDEAFLSQGNPAAGQEDLGEYIRVTSPGVLVVIVSLLVMLAAVMIWGAVGTLPVTETVTGLVVDASQYAKIYPDKVDNLPAVKDGDILVFCFVDASRYNGQAIRKFGEDAVFRMPDQKTYKGKIDMWYEAPISMEEAKKVLFENDWVKEQCVTQNYNWWLVIRPTEDLSQYAFTLAEVTLLTDEVAPISFLLNRAGG